MTYVIDPRYRPMQTVVHNAPTAYQVAAAYHAGVQVNPQQAGKYFNRKTPLNGPILEFSRTSLADIVKSRKPNVGKAPAKEEDVESVDSEDEIQNQEEDCPEELDVFDDGSETEEENLEDELENDFEVDVVQAESPNGFCADVDVASANDQAEDDESWNIDDIVDMKASGITKRKGDKHDEDVQPVEKKVKLKLKLTKATAEPQDHQEDNSGGLRKSKRKRA
ncbi:uncharacterized protein MELLADRAFT_108028 [Melampsora larici-populina 98AG31]|uniref:Uncharacterized protein n=1 Tax=Melampsora larici-populina (strain 98AG31 / pathotype 3-4-7) TaxID=747676 RepID=F4RRQ7_MELLP|nr:uncharacterized protein MELLADRAFT_108028 [Melampsora larici-populina 98AG31]EGG04970.1 hypothetical protein MELLADRAFT_108028 [Melampsora larici-populina 98AG31]